MYIGLSSDTGHILYCINNQGDKIMYCNNRGREEEEERRKEKEEDTLFYFCI